MKIIKQLTVLALLLMAVLSSNSCTIGEDCELIDTLDLSNLTLADNVVSEVLTFLPDVVFGEDLEFGDEFIVNDSLVYQQWIDAAGNCNGCFFPAIDFSEKTLIGKYQKLDCNDFVLLMVTKEGNTYTHYTKAADQTQCGFASCQNYTFAWISVPKMQPGETVEFRYGESYYECNC